MSQDIIVGIVTRLCVGQYRVQFLAGAKDLSFLQNVQMGCGAHPAYYLMSTGGYFRRVMQSA
jgi:hypothetical protein